MYSGGSGAAGRLRADLQLSIYVQDFVLLEMPVLSLLSWIKCWFRGTITAHSATLPASVLGTRRKEEEQGGAGTREQIIPALPQQEAAGVPWIV